MPKHTMKTNVARLLDQANVAYELISYEVDETDLSAIHVAECLKENVEQVFKTIVLKGDKSGFLVCILPGNKEVNLKSIAKFSKNKKCEPLPLKDLLPVTGYIRGGCSPIGMKKHYSTYLHESALNFDYIYISAGLRGMQIKIAPNDLLIQTQALICDLCS